MPSSSQRGYGYRHRQLRRAWAPVVATGLVTCSRCPHRIAPHDRWDLDHTEDRSSYRGPAHASCNRAAGAAKTNRRRTDVDGTSRDW